MEQKDYRIAQWFRPLAVEPEVGSLIPHSSSLTRENRREHLDFASLVVMVLFLMFVDHCNIGSSSLNDKSNFRKGFPGL